MKSLLKLVLVLAIAHLLAVVGFGALVAGLFLRGASRHETIPVHDPRILESIHYHE